jgi:hypothetical protein
MSTTETKTKPQKTGLLQLPNELLFFIIEDQDMCWKDHFNIHHVSSRLFQLTFKHVYNGEKDLFEHACSRADVELMVECLKHRNVPTSQLWGPVYQPSMSVQWYDRADAFKKAYRTPLDALSEGYRDDKFSSDQYIKAAEWLFDNGYHTQQVKWNKGYVIMSVFPPLLLTMLATATDADHHRGICRVIEFLINQGLELPLPSRPAPRLFNKKCDGYEW